MGKLRDAEPASLLLSLLSVSGEAKADARVPAPSKLLRTPLVDDSDAEDLTPEERAARQAWSEQQALLNKIRIIADDARTYEQDTGVHALNVGFPLLSLPPGTCGGRGGAVGTRRILAPIAFIPVNVTVKTGAKPSVEIACRGGGADLVIPNIALLAWLEQQTGKALTELFADDAGEQPWKELAEITKLIASQVDLAIPEPLKIATPPTELALRATPRSDDDEAGAAIVMSAVLGLFPASNQGLLRDTREMIADGISESPVESFVRVGLSLDGRPEMNPKTPIPLAPANARQFGEERIVQAADPCQAKAVQLARECRGLVIHGPPGTGKSQTIANIIGDHLARGERVLFVCDKRTALDVVADRLQALGLGKLCATVHDPQRDQREFYKSVREQLDELADMPLKPTAAGRLAKFDTELSAMHKDLLEHHNALIGKDGSAGSFHHLVGLWLASDSGGLRVEEDMLQGLSARDFDRHAQRLREILQRAEKVLYHSNPWQDAAGISLSDFLATPMDVIQERMNRCMTAAAVSDSRRSAHAPPFQGTGELLSEAAVRAATADEFGRLLKVVDSNPASRWATNAVTKIRAAQQRVQATDAASAIVRSGALDNDLLLQVPLMPVSTLVSNSAVLDGYVKAFTETAANLHRIRKESAADDATIIRWLQADPKATASAKNRLDSVAPLARLVETSTLDPSLSARLAAAPLESGKIVEWLAALSEYINIADKWYGLWQFKTKAAARPAVKQFGLALDSTSAARVRQFLTDVQARQNLKAALLTATGGELEGELDDADLLSAFSGHHAVLKAIASPTGVAPVVDVGAMAPAETARVNQLVPQQSEAAATVLSAFGLTLNPNEATRVSKFFKGRTARIELQVLLRDTLGAAVGPGEVVDADLLKSVEMHRQLFDFLLKVHESNISLPIREAVIAALAKLETAHDVVSALAAEPARAEALLGLEKYVVASKLFTASWIKNFGEAIRNGAEAIQRVTKLSEQLETLEGVLRVREGLGQLPPTLAQVALHLIAQGKAASAFGAIRRAVIGMEINRRLRDNPNLQEIDSERLQFTFNRYRALSEEKRPVVTEDILHKWTLKQKERLLAGTGTRLNSVGADLRRRLTMRGQKAMRLRQVIAHGAGLDGGDPLFDLRPVWMASPETVAQLFLRAPIFDVILFDEASQCRLEEALPVLTRAKRVVIAGDPKQLPPTRFFESGVTTSGDEEAETEQELFEVHQGEVEDLLTAALGLDIQQCYLDVHYRSRNSDLIAFSNQQFYNSRLQAIPGHPRNRIRYAPLTLYRADGVYEKRRNVIEAEQVCKIVHDLLRRATPPSIGIACFNLVQRDLIVEKLEERADADPEFARRLGEARVRRDGGSNQGLFVKNLENVQGDERDHIIISTTYGADPKGKFRRSFGPVGMAGGGRRLNVLITRAREEVHLVTSIPRSAYTSLASLPAGSTPSGAWLLFAYLAFAEQLAEDYETAHRVLQNTEVAARASVNPRPSESESHFAKALAPRLAALHNIGSDVHWGNDGFCVDLALHHPSRAEDMTIGILCDTTRYRGTDDPVEWEVFRTTVHESQGWKLHRIWTPHFFRNVDGSMKGIIKDVQAALAEEKEMSESDAEDNGQPSDA
jgi:hypothetical protein